MPYNVYHHTLVGPLDIQEQCSLILRYFYAVYYYAG